MAKQIQLRRGTTTETTAFTGVVGEVTVDTNKDVLVVHDGITAGGFPVASRANADGTISLIKKDGTSSGVINSLGLFNNTLTSTNTDQAATAAQVKILNDTKLTKADLASGAAPIFAARAWVNFSGVGTVSIRGSGNVSSITDDGVGAYTVNFTTAMSDVNYCALVTGGYDNASHLFVSTPQTNSISVLRGVTGTIPAGDVDNVNVAIFR